MKKTLLVLSVFPLLAFSSELKTLAEALKIKNLECVKPLDELRITVKAVTGEENPLKFPSKKATKAVYDRLKNHPTIGAEKHNFVNAVLSASGSEAFNKEIEVFFDSQLDCEEKNYYKKWQQLIESYASLPFSNSEKREFSTVLINKTRNELEGPVLWGDLDTRFNLINSLLEKRLVKGDKKKLSVEMKKLDRLQKDRPKPIESLSVDKFDDLPDTEKQAWQKAIHHELVEVEQLRLFLITFLTSLQSSNPNNRKTSQSNT